MYMHVICICTFMIQKPPWNLPLIWVWESVPAISSGDWMLGDAAAASHSKGKIIRAAAGLAPLRGAAPGGVSPQLKWAYSSRGNHVEPPQTRHEKWCCPVIKAMEGGMTQRLFRCPQRRPKQFTDACVLRRIQLIGAWQSYLTLPWQTQSGGPLHSWAKDIAPGTQ